MSLAILSVSTIYLNMNHELDFTSLVNEEKYMSEHKIAPDNIDIDVDVSTTVAEDNEPNTSSNNTLDAAVTDVNETDSEI